MKLFDSLKKEVEYGLEGKNEGLDMGLKRLGSYVKIRKATQYLFGGFTGSAKTTCVDEIFILNPFDILLKKGRTDKILINYFSMERRKALKLARWFSRKCYIEQGIRIPMNRLLGWVNKEQRLTKDEHDLFLMFSDYFGELDSRMNIMDGRQNPTGIRIYMNKLAQELGVIEKIDEYHKVFMPNDPELIVLNIYDHAGKLKKEQGFTDKENIDKFSDDRSNIDRDLYGFSSVIVSQFNRSIANPLRLKNEDVSPQLEDFKSTADMAEDSDVVLSIFDPWRYKVADPSGYDLDKLIGREDHNRGHKYYRNLQVLKNSFGAEDIRLGLAYEPELGIFRTMPKKDDVTDEDYQEIINGNFFLK